MTVMKTCWLVKHLAVVIGNRYSLISTSKRWDLGFCSREVVFFEMAGFWECNFFWEKFLMCTIDRQQCGCTTF